MAKIYLLTVFFLFSCVDALKLAQLDFSTSNYKGLQPKQLTLPNSIDKEEQDKPNSTTEKERLEMTDTSIVTDTYQIVINMEDKSEIAKRLTARGMPCTPRIIDAFGPRFPKWIHNYMTYGKKLNNESLYKLLVYADIAVRQDKAKNKNSLYSSSFGTRFWKPVSKASSFINSAGIFITEALSITFLALSGKCTFAQDEACDMSWINSSSESMTSYEKLLELIDFAHLGPNLSFFAALVYNLADNIASRISAYSLDKYSQYLLLDDAQDYLMLVKTFVGDDGPVESLQEDYKYGFVDNIKISQSFFEENGPLYTYGLRTLLNSSKYNELSDMQKNILQRESIGTKTLENEYRKMHCYSWISDILHPLSGFLTLAASCSFTVALSANSDNVKWWSQFVSTFAVIASLLLTKSANYFSSLSAESAEHYMLYSYYKPANQKQSY